MLKPILKTALQNSTGKEMSFTFRSPLESLNGSYKVTSVKTGRGKGGSLLVTMQNLATGESLSQVTVDGKQLNFGTSVSEHIVNLTVDGTLFGPNSAEEDMDNLPKDAEMAVKLREAMTPYLGKEGTKITITSKLPSLNGEWSILSGVRSPGVFGQLRFSLLGKNGEKQDFWTYRHSGVISDILISD